MQSAVTLCRFLVIGLIVAAASGCSCSRNEDSAAPASPPGGSSESGAAADAPSAESAALPPEQQARLVRFHSPVLGRADAPVTIVEFLDPACEACRAFAPVVKQILFMYPDDVRVVVRYAAFHQGSDEAIRVLDAARRQGKFDETLTALFDRQEEWAAHGAPHPELAWDIARDAGVDLARARTDGRAASTDAVLRQEEEDIIALKVERTPTFFVNGRPLSSFGAPQLFDAVEQAIRRRREASAPAP